MKIQFFFLFRLITFVCAVSLDCLNVVNLAIGLHLDQQQPGIMIQLLVDCCSATGVTCMDGRVTSIYWVEKGLTGQLNSSSLPSSLTQLELQYNNIKGQMPIAFPNGMILLSLQDNLLTGNLPPLPPQLILVDIHDNYLTGSLPKSFPGTLTAVYLSNNLFTGSIPNPLPTGLQTLELQLNALSGNIPRLPNTIQCLKLGWPGSNSNHLSGSLILHKPVKFSLTNLWITNIVIIDKSMLTECDISNNPLLGNPNLVNLNQCSQLGLYSASQLPNTDSPTRSLFSIAFRDSRPTPLSASKTLFPREFTNIIESGSSKVFQTPFSVSTHTIIELASPFSQTYFNSASNSFSLVRQNVYVEGGNSFQNDKKIQLTIKWNITMIIRVTISVNMLVILAILTLLVLNVRKNRRFSTDSQYTKPDVSDQCSEWSKTQGLEDNT